MMSGIIRELKALGLIQDGRKEGMGGGEKELTL